MPMAPADGACRSMLQVLTVKMASGERCTSDSIEEWAVRRL
jgi:hypothetical protein